MKKICPVCNKEYPAETLHCPECAAVLTEVSDSLAGRIFGSMVISIVMLSLLGMFTFSAAAGIALSRDKVSEFADRLDVMSLPVKELDMGSAKGENIREAVFSLYKGDSLKLEDMDTIYERGTFKGYIKDQLIGYARLIADGSPHSAPTVEKLKDVFDENIELINSIADEPITDEDINDAHSNIEDMKSFLDDFSVSAVEDAAGKGFFNMRLLCSTAFAAVTALLAAAMMFALKGINRAMFPAFAWGGTATVVCGASVLAMTFTAEIVSSKLSDTLIGSLSCCAMDVISRELYIMGGVISAVGIIMIICSRILKNRAV